jgi:SAM-dependent methyltransferase
MMSGPAAGAYVTDVPYLRDFKPYLAPAWLDHVALVGGVAPPSREGGFSWCDLGCGQGVTAAILAATHPHGVFHGIDLMPAHIDHARHLAAEAGAGNVRFDAADFAAAAGLGLPGFDYIVAHGVYTWVDEASRRALLEFIDAHLRPGGLVYLSYNTMPGWAADLPVQYLLRLLTEGGDGDSGVRVAAAADFIRRLVAARAPALDRSYVAGELCEHPQDYAAPYLVHEFLHAGWQPVYVTELRAAVRAIGLEPVGSATLVENFDAWVLTDAAIAVLADIADPDRRELVRDFFLGQRFRADVFARDASKIDQSERERRLGAAAYALVRPPGAVAWRARTTRGRVRYDGPGPRALVAALSAGPRVVAEVPVGDILTLCAAGDAIPVENAGAAVGRLNRAILDRLDGPEEILWLALPCGTALPGERTLLRGLAEGHIDAGRFPGWREFLAAHGI